MSRSLYKRNFDVLNAVASVAKRIENIELAIAEYKGDITTMRAIDYSKEPVSGGVSSDIGDKLVRCEEKVEALRQEALLLQQAKAYVIDEILKLDFEVGKNILLMLYIRGADWADVEMEYRPLSHRQLERYRKTCVAKLPDLAHNEAVKRLMTKNVV